MWYVGLNPHPHTPNHCWLELPNFVFDVNHTLINCVLDLLSNNNACCVRNAYSTKWLTHKQTNPIRGTKSERERAQIHFSFFSYKSINVVGIFL